MMGYIDIATSSFVLLRASQGCRDVLFRRFYRRNTIHFTLYTLHFALYTFPRFVVEMVVNSLILLRRPALVRLR